MWIVNAVNPDDKKSAHTGLHDVRPLQITRAAAKYTAALGAAAGHGRSSRSWRKKQ
jgi:hypothetical protein